MKGLTPFQTVGPFFDVLLRSRVPASLSSDLPGVRIVIEGTLVDGAGNPVPDGFIETWQADGNGQYHASANPVAEAAPASFGYSCAHTDDGGRFVFHTVKPGAVPAPGEGRQSPHVLMSVMARGILTRYVTRVYFDDEAANQHDPVLSLVAAERRATLIAQTVTPGVYRFDVRLQGPGETVFFDV